jgi:hypothetical protein
MTDRFREARAKSARYKAARRARLLLAAVAALGEPARTASALEAGGVPGGSLRTVGALVHRPDTYLPGDQSAEGLSQTLLRLSASDSPGTCWTYEIHAVQSLTWQPGSSDGEHPSLYPAVSRCRYRALDAEWEQSAGAADDGRWTARLWLDRAAVHLRLPRADVALGRQAVTFGKAYFWNPLDAFLPFDPNQFDRDYKPGVDALRIDVPLGPLAEFTLVGGAGREIGYDDGYIQGGALNASWYGSALLAHAGWHAAGWDWALQGGKVYGGCQAGGGAVGELGPLAVRIEGTLFRAAASPALPPPLHGDLYEDRFDAVAGAGRRFANSLDLQAEYFYNGGGTGGQDLTASSVRRRLLVIRHLGRHMTGFSASYEVSPLVTARLVLVGSLDDGSMQTQPTLSISVSDNADVLAGASISRGDRPSAQNGTVKPRSEFGSLPDLYFVELKYAF